MAWNGGRSRLAVYLRVGQNVSDAGEHSIPNCAMYPPQIMSVPVVTDPVGQSAIRTVAPPLPPDGTAAAAAPKERVFPSGEMTGGAHQNVNS
jgi:hypothetical protein